MKFNLSIGNPRFTKYLIEKYPESTLLSKNPVTGHEELKLTGWKKNVAFVGASFVARTLSIILSFPFEYRATILTGQAKRTTKIDKKKNSKITTGLSSIMIREYLFSMTFWPIMENSKIIFREHLGVENEVALYFGGSIVACLVSGTLTYPPEMIKTLRISFEKEYGALSSSQIVRNVYNEGGFKAILDGKIKFLNCFEVLTMDLGLWPRLIRTTIMNSMFFIGYSYLKSIYQKHPNYFPY